MKIDVIPDKMESAASDILLLNNELCNQMEQIESLVLLLNGDWQGEAEKTYASRILYVKNQFSHISHFFEDYAHLLRALAIKYEENDKDISSKIQLT
jgi:WXG100 family type VII secretion target